MKNVLVVGLLVSCMMSVSSAPAQIDREKQEDIRNEVIDLLSKLLDIALPIQEQEEVLRRTLQEHGVSVSKREVQQDRAFDMPPLPPSQPEEFERAVKECRELNDGQACSSDQLKEGYSDMIDQWTAAWKDYYGKMMDQMTSPQEESGSKEGEETEVGEEVTRMLDRAIDATKQTENGRRSTETSETDSTEDDDDDDDGNIDKGEFDEVKQYMLDILKTFNEKLKHEVEKRKSSAIPMPPFFSKYIAFREATDASPRAKQTTDDRVGELVREMQDALQRMQDEKLGSLRIYKQSLERIVDSMEQFVQRIPGEDDEDPEDQEGGDDQGENSSSSSEYQQNAYDRSHEQTAEDPRDKEDGQAQPEDLKLQQLQGIEQQKTQEQLQKLQQEQQAKYQLMQAQQHQASAPWTQRGAQEDQQAQQDDQQKQQQQQQQQLQQAQDQLKQVQDHLKQEQEQLKQRTKQVEHQSHTHGPQQKTQETQPDQNPSIADGPQQTHETHTPPASTKRGGAADVQLMQQQDIEHYKEMVKEAENRIASAKDKLEQEQGKLQQEIESEKAKLEQAKAQMTNVQSKKKALQDASGNINVIKSSTLNQAVKYGKQQEKINQFFKEHFPQGDEKEEEKEEEEESSKRVQPPPHTQEEYEKLQGEINKLHQQMQELNRPDEHGDDERDIVSNQAQLQKMYMNDQNKINENQMKIQQQFAAEMMPFRKEDQKVENKKNSKQNTEEMKLSRGLETSRLMPRIINSRQKAGDSQAVRR